MDVMHALASALDSSLVFAAYSVAKSAGDSQYLAEVCKDIAQSMMTSAGQSACAAQDDVLQCCDHLYIHSKITENQLLYLRHLVLIRDEDVAQLYDDYQEHESQDRLLRDLFRLANTHPRLSQEEGEEEGDSEEGDSEDGDSEEDEDEDDISEQWAALQKEQQRRKKIEDDLLAEEPLPRLNPYSRQASQERAAAKKQAEAQAQTDRARGNDAARTNTLNGLVSMMLRAKDITPVEATLLSHMISAGHEIILAAYELYQGDGDLEELQDTMVRCARLEVRWRKEEAEKQQAVRAAREGERKGTGQSGDRQRQAEREEEAKGVESEEESEGEGEDREEDGDGEGELTAEGDAALAQMLAGMGVSNNWQGTVPPRFILAVFAAAQRKLLTLGQARALCDLYQAQYDLVRAAWEVFNVQGDVVDFTDTLRRIVRDLNFREDGDVRVSKDGPTPRQSPPRQGQAPAKEQVMQAVREGQQRAEEAKSSREEALAAVGAAKRELLKHSLEIMVKQGLVSSTAATGLYERALRGDPLTDAAIDSYATNRDIMEFLDTLQILANNSPEQLENLMRAAMEEDGEGQEEGQGGQSDRENSSPSVPEEDYEEKGEEDDYDEDDDAAGGDMDQAQKELRALVQRLCAEGVLDKATLSALLRLIVSRDDRIMAAHDVYR